MKKANYLTLTVWLLAEIGYGQGFQGGDHTEVKSESAFDIIIRQPTEIDSSPISDRPDWFEDRYRGLIDQPSLTGDVGENFIDKFIKGENFRPVPVSSDEAPLSGSFGGSSAWRAISVCRIEENCEALLSDVARWVSVQLDEGKCDDARTALSKNLNNYQGIWNENGKISEVGIEYLSSCFSKESHSRIPSDYKSWIYKRVGFLRQGENVCQITFITNTIAVTAGHCLNNLSHPITVSGASDDESRKIWTRKGIVVDSGLNTDIYAETNDSNSRFNDKKFDKIPRDYAFISPVDGKWPLELDSAPLTWEPEIDFDGRGMLSFLWINDNNSSVVEDETQWTLYFDGSPSCVIGSQRIDAFHGVHGCQAVLSSSGSPILTLIRDRYGRVKGVAFGIHVGPAATAFDYPTLPPANLAITIPTDIVKDGTMLLEIPIKTN